MEEEFVSYKLALKLKELGFPKNLDFRRGVFCYYGSSKSSFEGKLIPNNCFVKYSKFDYEEFISAPLWQQAVSFLYMRSNKQINVVINGEDSYEELCKKFDKAIEDFRNLYHSNYENFFG